MWHDDILAEKVHAYADVHYEHRNDIAQYYQQTEGKNWKGKLADALAPFTKGKNGQPQSHASVMRRFQARGGKSWEDKTPSKKQKEEYKALGKTLPPKSYKLPFSVHVAGQLKISANCVPCSFTVEVGRAGAYSLQGANAEAFARNPNMWDLVVAYFEGDPDNPVEGWCDVPSISITA